MAEFYNNGKNGVLGNGEEFQEEDVWGMMRGRGRGKLGNSSQPQSQSQSFSSAVAAAYRILPSPPSTRAIPRVKSGNFESQGCGGGVVRHRGSSAPVDIPNWSKFHRRQPNSTNTGFFGNAGGGDHGGVLVEEEDDEDSDELLPPHEIIARRMARTPIPSFSMCEGIGRTLKGRDLSRVRNAILTKTGFLE